MGAPPVGILNHRTVPELATADKVIVPLPQREPFVTEVILGEAFTTTVVATDVVHPGAFTVTLYIPALAAATFVIVGFCKLLVKLDGPVQAYVNGPGPPAAVKPRLNENPAHTGPLFDAEKVYTVTEPGLLKALPHAPLVSTARYNRVWVIPEYESELVVLATSVQITPPSVENCHFCTVPVFPVSVKVPEFVPPQ